MADNITIPAKGGSGTTNPLVSTEEVTTLNGGAVTAQHVQRTIPALRTADGTAVDLTGDAANGLDVDVTRLPALAAGTNNIGDVDVLTLPALPSGTNNIGDVDIASIAAGTNNIGDVDVLTVPADPFGANADAAATAGSTGSMQAKLRLITSQLDSIKTAVETLDNAISGSEMQVDVVGSLPAGSATIGEVGWAEQLDRNNDEVRIAAIEEENPATFRPLLADANGRIITRPWGADTWAQGHAPAANTIATTTKAAGGSGVRHICTGLTVTFVAGVAAPAAIAVAVVLRDGASGAGTVVWAAQMSLPAVAGESAPSIFLSGLNIRGTANTAMTLEFLVAGGANTFECVGIQGVSVTEA